MAEKILLLGHGKMSGLELAGRLTDMGYQPVASTWRAFEPKAFGRDRPRLILADVDKPAAIPMRDLAPAVRRLWGKAFPIIAVTADGKFRTLSGLLDDGATDALPKAAPAPLLGRKIERCLRESLPPAADELTEEVPGNLADVFFDNAGLVRLGDLASVHPGATPRRPHYRRMAPPDHDWRGVLTSDVVERFHLGKPTSYLSWNRLHLFRVPPPSEYSVPEKVVLRRAGPPLVAAVDRSRLPAGTDMYAIVPNEGVGAGYLACLLNSRLLDFYFNRLAGVGRDGRLRLEAIREAPVPPPTRAAMQDLGRVASLLAHFGPSPESWIDRQSRAELCEEMENTVFRMYGVDSGVRGELEALHF